MPIKSAHELVAATPHTRGSAINSSLFKLATGAMPIRRFFGHDFIYDPTPLNFNILSVVQHLSLFIVTGFMDNSLHHCESLTIVFEIVEV